MHEFLTPFDHTSSDAEKLRKAQFATASVPMGATLAVLGTRPFLPNVTKEQEKTLIDVYKKLYPGREIPQILEVEPPESFWKKLLQQATVGTHYSPADKSIFLFPGQKDTAVLAHELGHAMSKPLGSKLYRTLYTAGKFSPIFLSTLPLLFRGGLPEEAEPYYYGTAAALSAVPLYEEAAASARALKAISKIPGPGKWKRIATALASLVPAYGTYAAMASTPFLAQKFTKKFYGAD